MILFNNATLIVTIKDKGIDKKDIRLFSGIC